MATSFQKIIYYTDLICEKIYLHSEAFADRIIALRNDDMEKVDFIEKMKLEPLDRQISYLTTKALSLFEKGGLNG